MKSVINICCLVLCLQAWPFTCLGQEQQQLQTVENLYQANRAVIRGEKYMGMNLWDEAEQEYWKAVALDFSNIRARKGLGDVYRKKKDFDRAVENYQVVLNQQPNNVDIQYLISLSYYDNYQFDQAITAAEKALRINPELAKAENLVRLSKARKSAQGLEKKLLGQKEKQAVQQYRVIQEKKEGAFIGSLVPGWRLIQTGQPGKKWAGYTILGATAGLMLGGYMLRSKGQQAYDQSVEAVRYDIYLDQVDLGRRRFNAGGYMFKAALGMVALNLFDSVVLKGKIFGGKSRVKPSLPERDRHKLY